MKVKLSKCDFIRRNIIVGEIHDKQTETAEIGMGFVFSFFSLNLKSRKKIAKRPTKDDIM